MISTSRQGGRSSGSLSTANKCPAASNVASCTFQNPVATCESPEPSGLQRYMLPPSPPPEIEVPSDPTTVYGRPTFNPRLKYISPVGPNVTAFNPLCG